MKRIFAVRLETAVYAISILAFSQAGSAHQHLSPEQLRMSAEERNRIYAPWNPDDINRLRNEVGLIGPGPQGPYPTARFPGYLRTPESIDKLLPQARYAVVQRGGRSPLGLANPGDVVLIPVPHDADPMVQEAIRRAFAERNIEARILYEHDLAGVSKEVLERIHAIENVFEAGDGQQELNFLRITGKIDDWDHAVAWTREQDPALADATWPEFDYGNPELERLAENYGDMVNTAIINYLDEHPEIDVMFWRDSGRAIARQDLRHHGEKLYGNYTYFNNFDIMSKVPAYPSDVWRLIESRLMEATGFTDRVEVSDPEGSAFYFVLTTEQAQSWSRGAYGQGHMFMIPVQASGIFPSSYVDYPARSDTWLPPVQMTRVNGIIASSNSHASNHPRMEIHIRDGYVRDVRGGGLYGDGFRLWLNYPKINELTWPFQEHAGFWWLFEAGTATNPKYFKHPGEILEGNNMSERNAGGVIHWAFGSEVKNGPEPDKEKSQRSPRSIAFGKEHKLPIGHAMHNHTLLPTYQVRLRDSGQWLTLIEHGQILASDNPEVRALASRYGNPDVILSRDWIPEIPGITAPGNYDRDYSSDPGRHWTNWANSIINGTNRYQED